MQPSYLLLTFAIIFVMVIMYSPAVEAKAGADADADAHADAGCSQFRRMRNLCGGKK
uniref:U4-myrmicitoxin-Tb1a n=1 Tax=Tetramorium bicarinatum TaxID=219812 RepID=TX4A_TETBN|nr:RecName: Full=U-myrmicitoxin(01)-Tb3a; Short=MYRTX(01)-Tb3; Short=U-MYRTX(01)-Tb3a; Flags: Precursor [Tetramorium bicarinatum]